MGTLFFGFNPFSLSICLSLFHTDTHTHLIQKKRLIYTLFPSAARSLLAWETVSLLILNIL